MIAQRQKDSLFWQAAHLLGSLQLALLLLATIAIACAVATFTESHFDTSVAHAYIYKAPWFMAWLTLLCINLFCVTLTRWPWEKKHFGFIITHYGIITLLFGAIIGSIFGFEGNVTLQIHGEPVSKITTRQNVLQIESPADTYLYLLPFDASVVHPSEKHPTQLTIPGTRLQLIINNWSDHLQQIPSLLEKNDSLSQDALIFRLSNQKMHHEELVVLGIGDGFHSSFDFFNTATLQLVPSKLTSPATKQYAAEGEFSKESTKPWLIAALDPISNAVHYQLGRGTELKQSGVLNIGEMLPLGWGDWQCQLLQAGHHEALTYSIQPAEKNSVATKSENLSGTPGFRAFLKNEQQEQGPTQWVISGEVTPLTVDTKIVRIGYGLKLQPVPFSIELLDFEVPRDEGTDTPGDFRATVRFKNFKTGATQNGLIHMNHPASFPGGFLANLTGINYKFSQAQWNPKNLEETTLQVLYDPGWLFKWIGSLGICIGIAIMFYFGKKK